MVRRRIPASDIRSGTGVAKMDKIIHCRDLGWDCTFATCKKTEVELYQEILEHGRTIHGLKEFSRDLYDRVRTSIQGGFCDLEEQVCGYSFCPGS
jgi:predicted small metal-binding protein